MTPRPKWIEPHEVSEVIAAADTPRNKALLAVVYQCGLRRSEAGILKRQDYDGHCLMVTRNKHPKPQVKVRLWARTKVLLDSYLSSRKDVKDPLFLGRMGKGICGQMVYYIHRAAAVKAGLDVVHQHPHTLRHSIAAHMARAGVDVTEIQRFLGHVSAEMTVAYMAGARDCKVYDVDSVETSHHAASW